MLADAVLALNSLAGPKLDQANEALALPPLQKTGR